MGKDRNGKTHCGVINMGEFSEYNVTPRYYHGNLDQRLYDPTYAGRLIKEAYASLKEAPIISYPAGDIREVSLCGKSTIRLSYWLTIHNCHGVKEGCVQLGKVMHTIYMEEEHEVNLKEMIASFNNFMRNNKLKFIQQLVES